MAKKKNPYYVVYYDLIIPVVGGTPETPIVGERRQRMRTELCKTDGVEVTTVELADQLFANIKPLCHKDQDCRVEPVSYTLLRYE